MLERIPLTIRHRYDFSDITELGDSLDAAGWDQLRRSDSIFGQWDVTAQQLAAVRPRVEAIHQIARELGARSVCSYAVGGGLIERELASTPGLELTVTEYAPETVKRLHDLFARVTTYDLRNGPLPGFDLHVLHRVDTELSNRQWRRYFDRINAPHLMVFSGFVDLADLRREVSLLRRHATKAGWVRTRSAFRLMLRGLNVEWVSIGDLEGALIHR